MAVLCCFGNPEMEFFRQPFGAYSIINGLNSPTQPTKMAPQGRIKIIQGESHA
jgi:hypothetical protein